MILLRTRIQSSVVVCLQDPKSPTSPSKKPEDVAAGLLRSSRREASALRERVANHLVSFVGSAPYKQLPLFILLLH